MLVGGVGAHGGAPGHGVPHWAHRRAPLQFQMYGAGAARQSERELGFQVDGLGGDADKIGIRGDESQCQTVAEIIGHGLA